MRAIKSMVWNESYEPKIEGEAMKSKEWKARYE